MDKWSHAQYRLDEINYPFRNFNGATVDVWEWISNFTSHFIMDVITYIYITDIMAWTYNHIYIKAWSMIKVDHRWRWGIYELLHSYQKMNITIYPCNKNKDVTYGNFATRGAVTNGMLISFRLLNSHLKWDSTAVVVGAELYYDHFF